MPGNGSAGILFWFVMENLFYLFFNFDKKKIITGSHDSTIRCWDIIAGKTMCTLTNHKKSVRSIVLHPKWNSMASASPDNIKEWKLPKAEFVQNLSGHSAILNALAVNSDNVLVSAGKLLEFCWKNIYLFIEI
jgi:pleiotropic regulator 1